MLNVIRSIRSNYFAFFAVGYLIAITANTFFYTTVFAILVGCLYYGFIFFKRGNFIDSKFHMILIFVTIILLGQSFLNGVFVPLTILGVYLRFFTAYFIIKLVNKDFYVQFINFVFISGIVGLVIYILFSFFPTLVSFCETNITPYVQPPFQEGIRKHIIIYDYSNLVYKRFQNFGLNAGFYWEPGAQAIFVMFAMMFHTFSTGKIINKINIWLFIILLTTFSTTGYICFLVFLLSYNLAITQYKVLQFLISGILLIIFYTTFFSSIPFLKNKIETDIQYIGSKQNEGSRFESFVLDFETALENPLFGKDIHVDENGETIKKNATNHRNNGIGVLLGTYGFIAFFIYMWANIKGFSNLRRSWGLNKQIGLIYLLMFLLLNFGMPLTLRPFFYGLTMLFLLNTHFTKSYNL
jgi:hypothetical protein